MGADCRTSIERWRETSTTWRDDNEFRIRYSWRRSSKRPAYRSPQIFPGDLTLWQHPHRPRVFRCPPLHAQSFSEKLNSKWHERALQGFMVIVLAHWGEHLAQAYQIWVMGWPVKKANGILGLWYPGLIRSEALHYWYALVMLIGLWILRKGFTGRSYTWWMISFWIQFWHHIEHLPAHHSGDDPSQLLWAPGAHQHRPALHSARAAAPLLQLDRVHPHGGRDVLPHVSARGRAAHRHLHLLVASR